MDSIPAIYRLQERLHLLAETYDAPYNILVEFSLLLKLYRLIKTCLNEAIAMSV
jgi:hypothetical protein